MSDPSEETPSKEEELPEVHLPKALQSAIRRASETGTEPGRDLWPGIEERLGPRRKDRRSLFAVAAAVLLALLVGLTWRLAQRPPEATLELPKPTGELVASSVSNADLRERLARHREESERLLTDVEEALSHHPQQVGDEVQQSLAAIDGALAELEKALVEAPGEPRIESRLAGLYEQHLQVLRSLDGRLQGRSTLGEE